MKTPPILLKLLHNSAAKPSPNFNKTASRKDDGGFTLLEVLVIALLIGIFSSIAAPSWQGFITRQRVRTVNDRVFQSLRFAQSEAKRTKRDITVTFNYIPNNPVADPPTVTIDTIPPGVDSSGQPLPLRKETFSSGGEIKPGTISLVPNATSITFDYLGNVNQLPPDTVNPNIRRFVATVSTVNGGAKQCAIVDTIIGGMRTAEGNDPVTGCP
ncbi:prepilin-type N-terminal cleavage/methylation domain-containing protein [Microcoleus sp. MON2_D6]|uniref:prepilin-type N-terminal cleavage/methylation domain-containing protein n=1 Tax=unclassified Microcoleus TaxID=2642155 RepID=UPI002FCF7A76